MLSFRGVGEREPGTHCLNMRKDYGEISGIIHQTLSLPRRWTCMDKVSEVGEVREERI